MALAILLAGGLAIARMPADIFPEINIPIVSVVWQYGGLTPEDMADMITTRSERGMTTTVNDIEHMESQSYAGISVIRMYFHPGAKIEAAIAQISAQANSTGRLSSRGRARRPDILRYNAASVPILQLGLSSDDDERAGGVRPRLQLSSAPSSRPFRAPACRRPTAASSA